MSDKRMLIVPAEVAKKVEENRGDMGQGEFIEFLIEGQFKEEAKTQQYATKEEMHSFEQDIKNLFKNFLDFFVSYGLEIGKQSQSPKSELEELTSKLQELESGLASENKDKKATIKWK